VSLRAPRGRGSDAKDATMFIILVCAGTGSFLILRAAPLVNSIRYLTSSSQRAVAQVKFVFRHLQI
jgi:hypothetical protein